MNRFSFTYIAALLLLGILSIVSCKENEVELPEPEFKAFADDTVDAPAEGGMYTIKYILTNPAEDGKVTVELPDEWTSLSATTDKSVIIEVSPNEGTENRETTVTLTYTWSKGELSFEKTVRQEAAKAEQHQPFAIEINEVKSSSVKATVTPEDNSMLYLAKAIKKESFDAMSEQQFLDNEMADLEQSAANEGIGLTDYLNWIGKTGLQEFEIAPLSPETEYYLCVYGIDTSNGVSIATDVCKKQFVTLQLEEINCTFDINVEMNGSDFTVSVTPSDNNVWYFYDVIDPGTLDMYGSNREEQLTNYINETMAYFLSSLNYQLADIAYQGPSSYEYIGFTPNTDYIVFSAALNESGVVSSVPEFIEITTGDRIYGKATVTLDCDTYFDGSQLAELYPDEFGAYQNMAVVPVTATMNNDAVGFLMGCYEGDMTDENSIKDDDIIEELKQNGIPAGTIFILPWDEVSTFLAVAYDNEERFGKVFRLAKSFDKQGASPAEDFNQAKGTYRKAVKMPKHIKL